MPYPTVAEFYAAHIAEEREYVHVVWVVPLLPGDIVPITPPNTVHPSSFHTVVEGEESYMVIDHLPNSISVLTKQELLEKMHIVKNHELPAPYCDIPKTASEVTPVRKGQQIVLHNPAADLANTNMLTVASCDGATYKMGGKIIFSDRYMLSAAFNSAGLYKTDGGFVARWKDEATSKGILIKEDTDIIRLDGSPGQIKAGNLLMLTDDHERPFSYYSSAQANIRFSVAADASTGVNELKSKTKKIRLKIK